MVESIPDFKTEVMIGTVATAVKWLPQKSNDKELLVVTEKGTVHGFNTKTKKEILYYPEFEGQDCFLCLDIRADSKEYISGAKSGQIYCFDHVKSKIKKIFNQGEQLSIGHVNRVCSVRYLKTDLRTFISGACDKMIHIWDSRLSKVPFNLKLTPLTSASPLHPSRARPVRHHRLQGIQHPSRSQG